MKIKCIDNHNYYLTIGKIYDVMNESVDVYWIINDLDKIDWYYKDWFKTVAEIRNEKIDKLLK
jgi:hypothetical protein